MTAKKLRLYKLFAYITYLVVANIFAAIINNYFFNSLIFFVISIAVISISGYYFFREALLNDYE